MSEYTFADYGSNYPEIQIHHYGYLIPVNIQQNSEGRYSAFQIYSVSLSDYELTEAFGELKEQFPIDFKNAAFYQIRKKRDELLSECDWVIHRSLERNEEIPQQWIDYRQALRDLPNTYESVDDVVFPLKP